MKKLYKEREIELKNHLIKLLPKGETVYGITRSVSASGMSRKIDFYAFENNKPMFLTGYFAELLGYTLPQRGFGGIKVSGCGMDMIFHIVSQVGYKLYDDENVLKSSQL